MLQDLYMMPVTKGRLPQGVKGECIYFPPVLQFKVVSGQIINTWTFCLIIADSTLDVILQALCRLLCFLCGDHIVSV